MVTDEIVNVRTDRVVGQVQEWREHLLLIYEQLFFAPLRLCGNLPSVLSGTQKILSRTGAETQSPDYAKSN